MIYVFSFVFFLFFWSILRLLSFSRRQGFAGGKWLSYFGWELWWTHRDAYGAEVQTAVQAGHQVEWWSSSAQAVRLEGHSRDHLIRFCTSEGQSKGHITQEDTLSFRLKSPKRSWTLWGEIKGEPWMLGMRWEGQRSNSLELTCCRGIASLPITSKTRSLKLYHKSEWISPLRTHLKACSLRRRLKIGLPCSTFPRSPFHSHSAYWQYLV